MLNKPTQEVFRATERGPLLFLDFDGVLQTPALEGWLTMELTGALESLVRKNPLLQIVVTSTHREDRTLEGLRLLLPKPIGIRVIGATEVSATGRANGGRQLEIENWLKHHEGFSAWAAVDDETHLFSQGCAWLISTNKYIGWTDETTQAVKRALNLTGIG
jgi:hypothetical protein